MPWIALLLMFAWPFVAAMARAPTPYGDPNTPEGWAWAQVRNGQTADFNEHCPSRLDPRKELDPGNKEDWDEPCRQISPGFLVDLLCTPQFRDQIPRHGMRLRGAHIAGDVDLANTDVRPQVEIEASRIEGDVTLDDSRWRRPLSLAGSTVTGDFSAARIHADSTIMLGLNTLFEGSVDLSGAEIVNDLYMGKSSFKGNVDLTNATIDGTVYMDWAVFAGMLIANELNVGHDLFMRFGAKFKGEVFLIRAKIGGGLELRRHARAWYVDLSGAEAAELQTGELDWWCKGGKPMTGVLDNHLTLGRQEWRRARCEGRDDSSLPKLALRNFHVGAFQDSKDAWPPSLDLEGFRYDRLGGIAGVDRVANAGRDDMRRRKAAHWTDWLERDRTFSTQPYAELSSVLAAAGHRDTADAILFAGRERERRVYWDEGSYLQWTWLTFLAYVAGYGIGLYTFIVLMWVVGLTVIGAIVLGYSERARRRGWPWRLGASLHRLLPIIELSKEFSDFFDNPPPQPGEAPNLNRFQVAYFAGHTIAGWVLSFFLIAAIGGVIQKA